MPRRSEFVEYLVEMLQPVGEIRVKSMFGGWGFYADERFFAIVGDDAFYVKVDAVSRPEFEALGLKPFRFESGREILIVPKEKVSALGLAGH